MKPIRLSLVQSSNSNRELAISAGSAVQIVRGLERLGSMSQCAIIVLAIGMLIAGASRGETVSFGVSSDGAANVYPFGGSYSGEYQNIYSSTGFMGPFTITEISFDATNFNGELTGSATAMYDLMLRLGTTSSQPTAPGSFSANANNLVTVFDGSESITLTPASGLTFNLSTPFVFNPTSGENLVLDVVIHSESSSAQVGFAFDDNSTQMGRVFQTPSLGTVSGGNQGLVTHFSGNAAAVAPLPSSVWAGAVLLGILGADQVRRKRVRGRI